MDQPLLYMIGAGVLALILIVLILRFAVRPKKTVAPQATGLGLPVTSGPNAGRGEGKPLAPHVSRAAEEGRSPESAHDVSRTSGPGVLAREAAMEVGGAEPALAPAASAQGTKGFERNGCPKCGGRFLDGELEGPTLMVDGVGREDFQPLLTARECSACGYLELYTRPVRPA